MRESLVLENFIVIDFVIFVSYLLVFGTLLLQTESVVQNKGQTLR